MAATPWPRGGGPLVPSFEDAAKQVHAAHAASFKNEKHRKQ